MNDPTRQRAWDLAQELSVRTHCRTYRPAGDGTWLNSTRDTPMGPRAPKNPWAIYLADGRDYWLACFDFDAHTASPAQADREARECRALLDEHGIGSVLCESGPGGGRHVWAGTLDAIPARRMTLIATLMHARWSTLDPTPLTNPRTGCARPPYAPHRLHGASRVLDGDLDSLELPASRDAQWAGLEHTLRTTTIRSAPSPAAPDAGTTRPAPPSTTPVDADGAPWIPGVMRELPARLDRETERPLDPTEDASRRQFRILTACALRHWTWRQVVARLGGRPCLEHSRSQRHAATGIRTPRPLTGIGNRFYHLRRDWARAVKAVRGGADARPGDDPTFPRRARAIAAAVDGILAAINADEARWTHGGGASDRRVITALCLLALRAMRPDIESDIRRLALMCGIGRETARTSLRRLEADGWISLAAKAEGRAANRWKINEPQAGNTKNRQARPQVNTPPLEADRTLLLHTLERWLSISGHDAHATDPARMLAGNRLADGLARSRQDPAPILARLDETAASQGTRGTGARRERLYAAERIAWQWWNSELEWMKAPASLHRERRTLLLPERLKGRFPAIPRTRGRADWRRLRVAVADLLHPAARPRKTRATPPAV